MAAMTTDMPTPRSPRAPRIALETTLLVHGVPRDSARDLARALAKIARDEGAEPALVGVVGGRAIVGMNDDELAALLDAGAADVPKLNTGNLGPALFRKSHGATTVSATMELAARAGIAFFATGGLGGVHPRFDHHIDISADLGAFTRFPVAVITSGVKSILDIAATRELLETLGICVVGFRTDDFPAFYMRKADTLPHSPPVGKVDARFDDVAELARFIRFELARSNRGIIIANPIPPEHEIAHADWRRWMAEAEGRVHVGIAGGGGGGGGGGRSVTPRLLEALHEVSGGATLRANIALIQSNVRLAAQLAAHAAARS